VHQSSVGGKTVHALHSYMTELEYLMEPPYNCTDDDVNDKGFVHATTIIGGHDAIEEFMASEVR
jgi:hypothetical protein